MLVVEILLFIIGFAILGKGELKVSRRRPPIRGTAAGLRQLADGARR